MRSGTATHLPSDELCEAPGLPHLFLHKWKSPWKVERIYPTPTTGQAGQGGSDNEIDYTFTKMLSLTFKANTTSIITMLLSSILDSIRPNQPSMSVYAPD